MDEVMRRLEVALRAAATLDEVLREPPSSIVRDASIQRFEYTFEATWQAAKRFLRDCEGLDAASPAATIRHCHAITLLDEPTARAALAMVDDRNKTVHTYKEDVAADIATRLPGHARLLRAWLESMQQRVRVLLGP